MARKQQGTSSLDDQRAALFAAVKAAPDDDQLRLVLADWLEENGDEDDLAHAELIRVQCEILRRSAQLIDPENPEPIHDLLRSAGYHNSVLPFHFMLVTAQDECIVALRQREEQLVQRFGGRNLNVLPFRPLCDWHRGFAYLNLSYEPFRSREMSLFAASPAVRRVEALRIDVVPSCIDRIARNSLLAQVAGLEVSGSRLDVAGLARLLASSHLVGLQRLALWGAGESLLALEHAPQRERLTHFCTSGNVSVLLRVLTNADWPSLRVLQLDATLLFPREAETLAKAAVLSNLRQLSLINCGLQSVGVEALVRSPSFRCPALLEVGWNNMGPAGLRALLATNGLESLIALRAEENSLDDAAIKDLADSPRMANLLHLDLRDNSSVGPAGAEALASSPHLRRLASLNLLLCPIGEAGARALLHSPYLRRLQLTLDDTRISQQTLSALRERYFLTNR